MYYVLFSLFSIYHCTKDDIPNPNNTLDAESSNNSNVEFEQSMDKNNLTQTNIVQNHYSSENNQLNQNIDIESSILENPVILELINKLNEKFIQITDEINKDVNKINKKHMDNIKLINTIDRKVEELVNGIELVDRISNGFKQLIKGINDDINKIKQLYITLSNNQSMDNNLLDKIEIVNELN